MQYILSVMGTVRCHLEVSSVSTERDYKRRIIKAGATCRDTQVEPKAVKKGGKRVKVSRHSAEKRSLN